MSMLDRYRKPGGFLQLLNLIETCGSAKQEKFLAMIREEDPRWADAIEKKSLSIKRIFSWNQDTLAEVIGNLQDLNVAVILHGLDNESKEKVYKTFTHGHRRKVDDLFQTQKPTPGELTTMFMKVLVEVRKMITDGHLRMDKIDADLVVPDDIEEQLKKVPKDAMSEDAGSDVTAVDGTVLHFDVPNSYYNAPDGGHGHSSSGAGGHSDEEVTQLRRKVAVLNQENTALKSEMSKIKTKLEQIRKMVA
jgi:hypothetical protein